MNDFIIQISILAGQFFLLGIVLGYEVLAARKNLFALLVVLALLLLVQGQALWVLLEFREEGQSQLTVGYHSISWLSFVRANSLYFWTTCAFVFGWASLRWPPRIAGEQLGPQRVFRFRTLGYAMVSLWFIASAYALVARVGGLEAAITRPGQMIGGQTVLLLAVGLAKWPLISRLYYKEKATYIDVALFTGALVVILFNSRFLTCFAILQVLIALHYRRFELKLRWLAMMAIPAAFVLIVFGVYREFGHRMELNDAPAAFQDSKFDTLDWFYRLNVEGFVGVAGIMEHESVSGGLRHDYGLSEASVLLSYIPNSIRLAPDLPFVEWAKWIKEAFPYDRSVVPSGFELSYGHFGLIGTVSYGLLMGLFCSLFHWQARARGIGSIFCLIVGVQLLNGIRGSLFGAILFFGLADLLAFVFIYYCCRTRRVRRISLAAPSVSPPVLPLSP